MSILTNDNDQRTNDKQKWWKQANSNIKRAWTEKVQYSAETVVQTDHRDPGEDVWQFVAPPASQANASSSGFAF